MNVKRAVPLKRATLVIVESGLFFPFLEPPIARIQTVVLADLAVTLFPVVKLAGSQAKPLEKLQRSPHSSQRACSEAAQRAWPEVAQHGVAIQAGRSKAHSASSSTCLTQAWIWLGWTPSSSARLETGSLPLRWRRTI
jgi:hypothetical protein